MTHTGKLVYEETGEVWDEFFQPDRGWIASGGQLQSLLFAYHAVDILVSNTNLRRLTEWGVDRDSEGNQVVGVRRFTLHDYGCATGDGTAFLKIAFPGADVTGFDHSPEGINIARQRWPHIPFQVGSVESPQKDADLIWTSHTLEHLRDPAEAIQGLLRRCRALVVIVPKITEEFHGGHVGAEPTEEWLKRCPPYEFHIVYTTLRRFVKDPEVFVPEGNFMYVWKGEL